MADLPGGTDAPFPPRPLPATYWVVPGRFLVGEHPGSQSRADAMDRLRRFLTAGVTCFVDLTEAKELPSYEALLPFATPDGRRVEYLREPIRDHGVPAGPETVARVLATIDDALEAGHVVYMHCRAGIGRSATVAACWLANRGGTQDPLDELQVLWRQSERSRRWPTVPETDEQEEFVRNWSSRASTQAHQASLAAPGLEDRIRGALLGLALGDATGAGAGKKAQGDSRWTQQTALALCLAESLLETGRCDARDQVERYLAWQRDGHLSADGRPGQATADVARALATYLWRGQPMAGSHDPRDRTTSSLTRTVSAAAFALDDPEAAVALAAECSRTTHQSPIVLDACRVYAGLLVGAMRGETAEVLCAGLYEPVAGLWQQRPLRAELTAGLAAPVGGPGHRPRAQPADVVVAVANVRAAVAAAASAEDAIQRAVASAREPAVDGALAGALGGALWGAAALPAGRIALLPQIGTVERLARRLAERQRHPEVPGRVGR